MAQLPTGGWQAFCKIAFIKTATMSKQKLSLCAIIVMIASFQVNAQKKSSVILRGGANFANISINDNGDVDDNKMLTSFQVGFIGDMKLLPFLYLQPGVIFTGKGSKTESGNTSDASYFRATTNPYYIEVPVNLVFKTPGPIKFFAGAGPYIAVGVAGKNKAEGKFLGNSFKTEEQIDWSNDDPSTLNFEEGAGYGILKRFDYGLNGTAGIETSHIVFGANYGLGLAKLQSGSNSSTDNNNKHRVISLTLGIKL
jgi:hypothetical protein